MAPRVYLLLFADAFGFGLPPELEDVLPLLPELPVPVPAPPAVPVPPEPSSSLGMTDACHGSGEGP